MPKSGNIAFVSPRFAEGSTIGGAETLLKKLAEHLADLGHNVTFLTTCATDHFSWKNTLPEGIRYSGKIKVIYFPADENRDVGSFLDVQQRICRGTHVTEEEEHVWLRNNINSSALCSYLRINTSNFDRIIMGPYLFGLIYFASQIAPEKTFLVPCLHDEPFAYLKSFRKMFLTAKKIMFNTLPEQSLASQIFGMDPEKHSVVGMGIDAFDTEPHAFAIKRNLHTPYVIYSGRREGLKGTPMLIDYLNAFRKRTSSDIKLVLTGSGAVQLPEEIAPHVLDLGFVEELEKREAMAGAIAFCHPSALESLGIVILESWLAQTPALVNSRSEVLRHQCRKSNGGLWFRNYPEFEESLLLLVQNKTLRDNLGANGRKYVLSEYSWNKVENNLLHALNL